MNCKKSMFSAMAAVLFAALLCFCQTSNAAAAEAPTAAEISAQVKELTGGARAKIVWVQDAGEISDPMANRGTLRLMGFDTDDGKGMRTILPGVSGYYKPVITPSGKMVAFGNITAKNVCVVNWDGTGLRVVVENASFEDAWMNPEDGSEWVYATVREDRDGEQVPVLRRFKIDDPSVNELVWDKTPVSYFQVSPDGRAAAGQVPGSGCGLLELPNIRYHNFYGGCWPSMAPDNSYRIAIFRGHHKGVHTFTSFPGGRTSVRSEYNTLPGYSGNYSMYHPRWSNDVRFLTATGPYIYPAWRWSEEIKLPMDKAAHVEIFLGKYTRELTDIEGWVRLTYNDKGDFWGDAWIEPAQPIAAADAGALAALGGEGRWPASLEGMLYLWENAIANNQVIDPVTRAMRICEAEPRVRARYDRNHALNLTGGFATADHANNTLLNECKRTNALTLELTVTPDNIEQVNAVIATFSWRWTDRNFSLLQSGENLVFRLRTSETNRDGAAVTIGSISAGVPAHVVVTYADGVLTGYINGRQTVRSEIGGDFSNWGTHRLLFGEDVPPQWIVNRLPKADEYAQWSRNWSGTIEGIAIMNRALAAAEVERNYELYRPRLAERKPAARAVVRAKLDEITATPSPGDIHPYRRCLVVYVYTVKEVLEGKLNEEQILVAHWGILDVRQLPIDRNVGEEYRLVLEPFDDHPQLESERQVMETELIYLPIFYDVELPRLPE